MASVSPLLLCYLLLAVFSLVPKYASANTGSSSILTQIYLPSAASQQASVMLVNNNRYIIKYGIQDQRAVAWGVFYSELNETGWGRLYVHTSQNYTGVQQSYAAGFLEGALTASYISQHYINYEAFFWQNQTRFQLQRHWFEANYKWAEAMIASHPHDPYWIQVGNIYAQVEGLAAGYAHSAPWDKRGLMEMIMLGSWGDIMDLNNVVDRTTRPDWSSMSVDEIHLYLAQHGHCSALIKVAPDLSWLISGHTAWFTYTFTLRIMKHYDFPLNTASRKVTFSSYPAALSSIDDFYITDQGLNVIETSLSVVNHSIYDLVTPSSLLSWIRVMVSNRMARGGREWTEIFAAHNSGTYNNEWLVVDYKLFNGQTGLPDNLFWLAEQIPGLVVAEDLTKVLRFGYFPSYNIPFFPAIQEASGWTGLAEHDPSSAYDFAPRANVFRRNNSLVEDLPTFQALLRYNNFQHDPLAKNNPWNQIAARGDLAPKGASCMGAYDTKVISNANYKDLSIHAQSGPTRYQQPAFSWENSPACVGASRSGLPDTYVFPWILFKVE